MDDRKKGIFFMLGSSLSYSLMSASSKFAREIPVAEKLLIRNCITFLVVLFLIYRSGESPKGNNKKLLILRGVVGFFGVFCYFYSVDHLSLGDATLLGKTSAFFSIIIAAVFLGEKMKKYHIPVLTIGLIGAAMVLKPGLNYNLLPAALGVFSAITASISYAIMRYLRTTDSPNTIFLYFSGICIIGYSPIVIINGFIVPTLVESIALILMSVFSLSNQLFLGFAFRHAPAKELSVFEYMSILFSSFIGIAMWREIPDIWSVMGGIFIVAAGIINYKMNKKTSSLLDFTD